MTERRSDFGSSDRLLLIITSVYVYPTLLRLPLSLGLGWTSELSSPNHLRLLVLVVVLVLDSCCLLGAVLYGFV